MWHQYLDRYCHRDRRALSAMHDRFHFLPDKRSDGAALCGFICAAHFGGRSFFTAGGRRQDVLYPVSGMWGLGLFPNGIFRYETADTFRVAVCTWQSGCMDSYFICRYFLLRCRLYAADRRAERTQSDGGIHDHESGICIFRAGRLVDIA